MRTLQNYTFILILIIGFYSSAQTKITAFEHVNIIPMSSDTILYNQRVLIANKRILKIESAHQKSSLPIQVRINATGKYLLPGFAETHYHLQTNIENELKLLIANGITSARNMAEFDGQDHIAIKKQIQENKLLGPHYYTTGPYLMRKDLSTLAAVDSVVTYHKKRGYDYIKIADNLSKDIYLKLLYKAHKAQIPVVGHGQRKLPLAYTLRMKSVAHLEEFMNIFSTQEKQSKAYLIKAAKQIKTSGAYISPTFGTFELIIKYSNPKKSALLYKEKALEYLPKPYLDYWKSDSINYRKNDWFTAPASQKRLVNEFTWQQNFTKILHDQGVPLMAGSDTYGLAVPGFSLHHEMELIHKAGLSTYETLKTATVVPARYFNHIAQSGTIEEGKLADLVLLDKNPLKDIRNTQTISGVFIKGHWLNRKKLDLLLQEVKKSIQQQ